MLKVIILTNNKAMERGLRKIFQNYMIDGMVNLEINVFRDLKNLLKTDISGAILFLHDGGDRNPIRSAHILRENDHHEPIVIITDSTEAVYDAFKVDAYRVIRVPVAQSDVYEVLDSFKRQRLSNKVILIKNGPERITVPTKDILYVSSLNKMTEITTKTGIIPSTVPLFQIEAQLPSKFFFSCHRSYIVNFINMRSVNTDISGVTMSNGDEIPVSRRKKTAFIAAREAFLDSSVLTII